VQNKCCHFIKCAVAQECFIYKVKVEKLAEILSFSTGCIQTKHPIIFLTVAASRHRFAGIAKKDKRLEVRNGWMTWRQLELKLVYLSCRQCYQHYWDRTSSFLVVRDSTRILFEKCNVILFWCWCTSARVTYSPSGQCT